jgi:spore maturation protein CgeB
MRILILDTYYPPFLSSLYARIPDLGSQPYNRQLRLILDQCFGTSDFYSSNLNKLGHEAAEIIVNCEPLQRSWAAENQLELDDKKHWSLQRRGQIPWLVRRRTSDWLYKVLSKQISEYKPDVLYVQDMNMINDAFIAETKSHCGIVVGQIACPIKQNADFRVYDYITSSFPHFVERFRRDGIESEYFKLGFNPTVLDHEWTNNNHQAVFVGSLSVAHQNRIELLETLAKRRTIDVWGSGIDSLNKESPLHQVFHGESWALDMYDVLRNAKIAINHHIDLAEASANNMRLFEATGVGTMLLTDWKANLHEMFEPGKEVVTYRSAQECAELISYFLNHEEERQEIARAGQLRTLKEHTYYHRMQELSDLLAKQLSRIAVGARA